MLFRLVEPALTHRDSFIRAGLDDAIHEGMTTATKQMWMKRAQIAIAELDEETQHKKTRFAVSAIGISLAGAVFVVLALAYPYLGI